MIYYDQLWNSHGGICLCHGCTLLPRPHRMARLHVHLRNHLLIKFAIFFCLVQTCRRDTHIQIPTIRKKMTTLDYLRYSRSCGLDQWCTMIRHLQATQGFSFATLRLKDVNLFRLELGGVGTNSVDLHISALLLS